MEREGKKEERLMKEGKETGRRDESREIRREKNGEGGKKEERRMKEGKVTREEGTEGGGY
jgi:hypothetical protein